ncbi:MAG: metallophosphoesterase [Pirellulales bacterium]
MIDPFAWLVLLAIPGHVSWLLWLNNNLHARPSDYRRVKPISKAINVFLAVGVSAALAWSGARLAGEFGALMGRPLAALDRELPPLVMLYVAFCTVNTIVGFLPWLVRRLVLPPSDHLAKDEAKLVDLRKELAPPLARWTRARILTSIPGNQALHLAVHTKRLLIPRLPPSLAGLRIVHLSDLHLTGELDRRVYEYFADVTQALEPDIVAITGDIVEKTPCWDWLPEIFSRYRGRYGGYFVLGNHDIRIDHQRTRQILVEAGLVNLGVECRSAAIADAEVLLCGNELPWLGPPPVPPRRSSRYGDRTLRVLLAHTPDQLPYARKHDVDLMLAGHVHGGQICIPPLGPILAPSFHGVHYAAGVFYESPTVMHVSRGTSGKLPLRFFCPPELALLILQPAATEAV